METKPGQYVVTGIVSGGRGKLGGCGGINNPVHYVRVKMFTQWIVGNIETEARWTLIPIFRLDLIYLSGGSYAGTKASKSDSITNNGKPRGAEGHDIRRHDFCFSLSEQTLE